MVDKEMTTFSGFVFIPDKKAILTSLACSGDRAAGAKLSALYDQMIETVLPDIHAQAVCVLAAKPSGDSPAGIAGCRQALYCLVTLGDALSQRSSACFQTGRYAAGLICDAVANAALFDCSCQFYQQIAAAMRSTGFGLTKRLSPGDAGVDLRYQRVILEQFATGSRLGITLTDGYMLAPVKSLAYLYGVAEGMPIAAADHDCSACGKVDCRLRTRRDDEVRLTVISGGQRQTITARTSLSVMAALAAAGLRVHSPCGGRGTCGKCRIKLVSGLLSQTDHAGGDYLACRSYPLTDCEIDITQSQEAQFRTVTDFQPAAFAPDSGFDIAEITFTAADRQAGDSLTRLINRRQGQETAYSLPALRKLGTAANKAGAETAALRLVTHHGRVVDLLPPAGRLLGLAVDIGTTTLAFSLVDLLSGAIVNTGSRLNQQRRYGADVISRIQYSGTADGAVLHDSICADIVNYVREFDAAIREQIVHVVISGNTTMLHFLLGLPATSLGSYPFRPVTTELQQFAFAELFADAGLSCQTTLLPAISAFVGADVAAGLLQCGFADSERIKLLLDIGTNGEIAVGGRERILCLATAAGPAFEGANLSCGTGSVSGAIDRFDMIGSRINYTTIDAAEPVGVCGSGILDIVAAGLRENVFDATGKFDIGRFAAARLPIAKTPQGEWLCFTQQDVRELQLAKSAMRAGLEIALTTYGCDYDAVDTVYLAGSFGSRLRTESAVAIGLLPAELAPKVKTAGNTSLGGAIRYLLNQAAQQTLSQLLAVSSHIELAAVPEFNDLFIRHLDFGNG